jgi:hypothetical protein
VNAHQAAEKIGTDARTLRRFLRSPKSTFKAVGSGGRYEFEEKDVPTLRKKFEEWRNAATTSRAPSKREIRTAVEKFVDQDSPMPVSILGRKLTRAQREARDVASRARVDRLEEALRASGKHISQRKDWAESR